MRGNQKSISEKRILIQFLKRIRVIHKFRIYTAGSSLIAPKRGEISSVIEGNDTLCGQRRKFGQFPVYSLSPFKLNIYYPHSSLKGLTNIIECSFGIFD